MSIYVFGYGSLINMQKNKEFFSTKRKVYPVTVLGLKRSFNVSSNNEKYKVLGVKENPKSQCNGILIKLANPEELAALLQRENNYIPHPLAPERIVFNYKKHLTFQPADQIIYFLPRPKYLLSQKAANQLKVRPNYLNICLAGAADYGEDFLQDFVQSL